VAAQLLAATSLAVPVVFHARLIAYDETQHLRLAVLTFRYAREQTVFTGVRVLGKFRRLLGTDRKITQIPGCAGIDQLMRGFRSAWRAGDKIASPNGMALRADTNFAMAFENKKQLLIDTMAMKWPCAFPRRHNSNVVPEFCRPDAGADGPDPGRETLAVSPGMVFELIHVDDGSGHWELSVK